MALKINFNHLDISKVPKSRVELHVHLDGAIRPETAWELARKKNINIGVSSFPEFKKCLTIVKPTNLQDFLRPFNIFAPTFIGDKEALERIAYEFCEDQAKIGVAYFEARFSPHLCSNTHGLPSGQAVPKTDPSAVTPRDAVESVLKGLKKGQKVFNIKARAILCCIRGKPEWSGKVLQLCHEFKHDGVVGIDIAGWHNDGTDLTHGEATCQEDIFAFEKAKELGIHRTAHAAEAGPASVVKEVVENLHAQRIGHGYRLVNDPRLYSEMKELGVHFETCPHSSHLTGSWELFSNTKHPIVQFAEDEANFSISTDDPTITGTNLEDEYELVRKLGLQECHIVQANFNAARSSFLPANEKRELLAQLEMAYGINKPLPQIFISSQKA